MSSHYCTYDITHSIYESTSSMRATYTLNMWHHSHYLCHHTHCIDYSTPALFMTSHSPHVWHPCIIQDITSSHIDLKPPFWGHHTHYIIHRVHCICVITPSLSQPLYMWYHIQYMWDILSTIFIISYSLCMTTQPCELITPHSAYVWHHLHYRRRHIHFITPSHNLHDFTSTSGMTSHPLYQTSQQLYLCHHNLSTDITPTFVWHHTHYMCDIIRTIYNLISTVMSSHYCTNDTTNLTYETTSNMQVKMYTIHVTSQSVVHVITPTVLRALHHPFVWHHTRHRYSIFAL